MSANERHSDPVAGREELKAQLRELEEFVTKATADGDPLPPAALEMVQRLREVVSALDGLTASFDTEA